MGRSRTTAKSAGTRFESDVARYLTGYTGSKIYRPGKKGSMDIGDLDGLTISSQKIVLECKNPGKSSSWKLSEWWKETEAETANAGAYSGVLIVSVFGKSIDKSACVVSEEYFNRISKEVNKLFNNDIIFQEIPSGISKLVSNLDDNTILKCKRKGSETPWYVFTLKTLASISDVNYPTVMAEFKEIEGDKQFKPLISVDSNGLVFEILYEGVDSPTETLLPDNVKAKNQYSITLSIEEQKELLSEHSITIYPSCGTYHHGLEIVDLTNKKDNDKDDLLPSVSITKEQLELLKSSGKLIFSLNNEEILLSVEK